MKDDESREILEETEWMIVYKLENGQGLHESKFLVHGATVAAETIKARWDRFSLKERYDFVRAYQAKPEVTSEDEKVLDFLMDSEDPLIWATIAPLLARHRNRDRVLAFLHNKLGYEGVPKANFYQALGVLSSPESVPILEQALVKHREEIISHPSLQSWDDRLAYLDYLACSATLFVITRKREFVENLKEMQRHPDQTVREMVGALATSSGIAFS